MIIRQHLYLEQLYIEVKRLRTCDTVYYSLKCLHCIQRKVQAMLQGALLLCS